MSAEVLPPDASGEGQHPGTSRERRQFADFFDAHAAHLFDYCCSLLAGRQDAADATQATLITAYALAGRMQDADRTRAWLLALARRECLSHDPVRASLPKPTLDSVADRTHTMPVDSQSGDGEPVTEDMGLPRIGASARAAAALSALPAREREVLDLVHRHAVGPAELAAVLGISAHIANARLTTAVADLEKAYTSSAAGRPDPDLMGGDWPTQLAGASGVRMVSAIPLRALPASGRRRTASVIFDPGLASYRESLAAHVHDLGADGFPLAAHAPPPRRKLVLASALLAALLLAPATVGGVLFTIFGGPHAVEHVLSDVFGQQSNAGTSAGGSGRAAHLPGTVFFRKKGSKQGLLPVLPAAHPSPSKTPKPRPHPTPSNTANPSPTPSSPSPTPSSPSPTPSSPSPTPSSPSPTSTP